METAWRIDTAAKYDTDMDAETVDLQDQTMQVCVTGVVTSIVLKLIDNNKLKYDIKSTEESKNVNSIADSIKAVIIAVNPNQDGEKRSVKIRAETSADVAGATEFEMHNKQSLYLPDKAVVWYPSGKESIRIFFEKKEDEDFFRITLSNTDEDKLDGYTKLQTTGIEEGELDICLCRHYNNNKKDVMQQREKFMQESHFKNGMNVTKYTKEDADVENILSQKDLKNIRFRGCATAGIPPVDVIWALSEIECQSANAERTGTTTLDRIYASKMNTAGHTLQHTGIDPHRIDSLAALEALSQVVILEHVYPVGSYPLPKLLQMLTIRTENGNVHRSKLLCLTAVDWLDLLFSESSDAFVRDSLMELPECNFFDSDIGRVCLVLLLCCPYCQRKDKVQKTCPQARVRGYLSAVRKLCQHSVDPHPITFPFFAVYTLNMFSKEKEESVEQVKQWSVEHDRLHLRLYTRAREREYNSAAQKKQAEAPEICLGLTTSRYIGIQKKIGVMEQRAAEEPEEEICGGFMSELYVQLCWQRRCIQKTLLTDEAWTDEKLLGLNYIVPFGELCTLEPQTMHGAPLISEQVVNLSDFGNGAKLSAKLSGEQDRSKIALVINQLTPQPDLVNKYNPLEIKLEKMVAIPDTTYQVSVLLLSGTCDVENVENGVDTIRKIQWDIERFAQSISLIHAFMEAQKFDDKNRNVDLVFPQTAKFKNDNHCAMLFYAGVALFNARVGRKLKMIHYKSEIFNRSNMNLLPQITTNITLSELSIHLLGLLT
tara:strand:+ start:1070 stop:3376 length:2307 start_codon:yes stop_codon:yes gene_type:complete